MKIRYYITVFVFLCCGCGKTLDNPGVLAPQPNFRINKMLIRDHAQSAKTIIFLYDHRNRLIVRKVLETGRMLEQFVYNGSKLQSILVYDEQGGLAYVNEQPLYSKDFGKIMEFYYLSHGSAWSLDTNNTLYLFRDSRILEIKHRYRPGDGSNTSNEYRHYFTYDEANNLSEYTQLCNAAVIETRRVLATDDKPNFLKHVAPLVFIFGGLPNLSGMGDNNVTSMEVNGEMVEFEYTYDEHGFPLSIKNRNEDFVRYEFEYGR